MKRILSFLILVSAFSIFDGCIMDGKSKDKEPAPADTHRPRAPKVSYLAYDSLVEITITGSNPNEGYAYWIYRDGKLLEPPSSISFNDGLVWYFLRDSLEELGVHVYTVQYGRHQDSLSEKSPEYIYNYQGHSPSGWVTLFLMEGQQVAVEIRPPLEGLLAKMIIQRRIGTAGDVVALDTLAAGGGLFESYFDTNLVPEDAYLYYRVQGVDALTDSLLPPGYWDSVQVKNKVWKYLPTASVRVLATEVEVSITNFPVTLGEGSTAFYLYRNETSAKTGAVKADSAFYHGTFPAPTLRDMPDSGDYYYWVEARDPWGRVSARSAPRFVRFTGRAGGPEVSNLTIYNSTIQVIPKYAAEVRSYILQRTQDTAKEVKTIDTLPPSINYPYYPTFVDRPTMDGNYFYRFASIDGFGDVSDPGPWLRTDFFTYSPVFGTLSVAIVNRGDRVQARIERDPGYFHVLRRSKSPSGTDTLGVDTLEYPDTSTTLTDVPAFGVWYYRVYRFSSHPDSSIGDFRTASVKVDFTGEPMGPAVLSINVGANNLTISVMTDPEALAYILERKADGKDWTVADTISVTGSPSGLLKDRPPQDGYWEYRVRSIRADLSATKPGQSMRSPGAFTYAPQYSNTLTATIRNTGASVECPYNADSGYVYYLMRGTSSDVSKGVRVDTMRYLAAENVLRDTPAKGIYYYWLQRESTLDNPIIYQSLPVKIEFTGSPEIISLTKVTGGIQITYPVQPNGDTLEIFRSTGKPEDLSDYGKVASLQSTGFPTSFVDVSVVGKPGFYHYRLAVRSVAGVVTDLGAAKSIYYEP